MWLLVFFDFPVADPEQRRSSAKFRKLLISKGLKRLQFSVYTRFCDSSRHAQSFIKCFCAALPPEGNVRFLTLPPEQFSQMQVFVNAHPVPPETPRDSFLIV